MADAEFSPSNQNGFPAQEAARVLEVTRRAWQLAPRKAHALARRSPLGALARRVQQRPPVLAHSW